MRKASQLPVRTAGLAALCLLAVAALGVERLHAQTQESPERVLLTAGRSLVLSTDFDITRIAVTNPEIADAVVVRPREVLVDGKGAGTVSLIVWGAAERRHYDIVVDRGVSTLAQNLQALFPGEGINVGVTDDAVILSGQVSSNEVMLRAAELTKAAMPKANVINMIQLPGGMASKQVMLQVRVAEVNRNALQQAGISMFVSRADWVARSSPDGTGPSFEGDTLVFSDFLNLFFFSRDQGVGAVIRALQTRGFLQSLAEPNLIAYNGQEASFLAGGEIPVPTVSGNSGQVQVTYKEFGIRLTFTPTIAGDVIRIKVRPEVSSLDFANGVTLAGFRIPALITRRAETDVELRDGQSFAIAGLLNNLAQTDRSAIPLLSKLPVIGPLFRAKNARAEQTELMVLITPRLVRPLDPDEVPALPTRPGQFLRPTEEEMRENYGAKPPGEEGLVDAPSMPPAQGTKPPAQPDPATKKPPKQ
jgi:pilus assembly protein CpaC